MNGALRCESLTVGYDGIPVSQDLSFEIPDGAITALLGPNGCGKSTVLRALANLHRPDSGRVTLDGQDLSHWSIRDLARTMALLPQQPVAPPDLSVRDLIAFGRFPHRRWFDAGNAADHKAIDAALVDVDLTALADRPLHTLSGGQRQRAWLGMVLAQRTRLLLLDEPTSALDLTRQIEVLEVLRRLQREHRNTVVVAMHDLNLAARWADHIIVLHEGRMVAAGPPRDVLSIECIAAVYGVQSHRFVDPADDVPVFAIRGLQPPRHIPS